LHRSVKSISDIIKKPGHINVDFADVRAIMKDRGLAIMGAGIATGINRAQEAAQQAINSPLLENMTIAGAQGVLLNISGGTNLGLHEIRIVASIIHEQAHPDANIILGSVIDESLNDELCVTLIATGFNQVQPQVEQEIATPLKRTASIAKSITLENKEAIDFEDLDVPTFMRQKKENEQENL